MYFFNRNIFEFLLVDVFKIKGRDMSEQFNYKFNFFPPETEEIYKLYSKLLKLNFITYSLSLLLIHFQKLTNQNKKILEGVIQSGTIAYMQIIDTYLLPHVEEAFLGESVKNTAQNLKVKNIVNKHKNLIFKIKSSGRQKNINFDLEFYSRALENYSICIKTLIT